MMTDDWLTPLAAVFLATFAVLSAGAEVKLGITSPLTGRRAWSGEETQAGAYLAPGDPDAAGGMLDQLLTLVWSMTAVIRTRRPEQSSSPRAAYRSSLAINARAPPWWRHRSTSRRASGKPGPA